MWSETYWLDRRSDICWYNRWWKVLWVDFNNGHLEVVRMKALKTFCWHDSIPVSCTKKNRNWTKARWKARHRGRRTSTSWTEYISIPPRQACDTSTVCSPTPILKISLRTVSLLPMSKIVNSMIPSRVSRRDCNRSRYPFSLEFGVHNSPTSRQLHCSQLLQE